MIELYSTAVNPVRPRCDQLVIFGDCRLGALLELVFSFPSFLILLDSNGRKRSAKNGSSILSGLDIDDSSFALVVESLN